MRGIRLLAIAGAILCVLAPAHADVKSYCEAHARNEANVRLTGSAILGPSVKPTPEEWAASNKLALAECLARYEPKQVGAGVHQELWVPAEELADFNRHIVGVIEIMAEFNGKAS